MVYLLTVLQTIQKLFIIIIRTQDFDKVALVHDYWEVLQYTYHKYTFLI